MASKRRTTGSQPAQLAEQMLAALERQRATGREYPLAVKELARLAGDMSTDNLIGAAARSRLFERRAISARRGDIDSPVVLHEDIELLAASPWTLQTAFNQYSGKVRAVTIANLAGKVTDRLKFRKLFQKTLEKLLEEERLPENIAWIYAGRTASLFRLDDLQPRSVRERLQDRAGSSPSVERLEAGPKTTTGNFTERFERAFAEIDHRHGNHNLVKLLDLREALADVPRDQFDSELRQLRVAGRYGLSGAESRRGISEAEREAGIHEAGSLLMLVSRRT